MKTAVTFALAVLIGIVSFLGFGKVNSNPVFYDKNGQLTSDQVRIWSDTVVPTTTSGQVIDISSAGFSVLKDVSVVPEINSGTVSNMPIVVIKSRSSTQIVVNIMTQNNAVVSLLGVNVLSGPPLQFGASPAGITLHVIALGIP